MITIIICYYNVYGHTYINYSFEIMQLLFMFNNVDVVVLFQLYNNMYVYVLYRLVLVGTFSREELFTKLPLRLNIEDSKYKLVLQMCFYT